MPEAKRLIDAHEVKAKLRSVRDWFGGPPQTDQDKLAQAVVKMCIEEIDKLKPVDAAPVVRCKDCKHGCEDHEDGYLCDCALYGLIGFTRGRDFCSYGERRTDG